MEIRNNTPSFGMAVRIPSQKVMEVVEAEVTPRAFKAFIKEQAKLKNIDIELNVSPLGAPYAQLKPKDGVYLYGFDLDDNAYVFEKASTVVGEKHEAMMSKLRQKHPKLEHSKLGRSYIALRTFLKCTSSLLYNNLVRPARTVPLGLRIAGDDAIKLDKVIISKDKNIREYSELLD